MKIQRSTGERCRWGAAWVLLAAMCLVASWVSFILAAVAFVLVISASTPKGSKWYWIDDLLRVLWTAKVLLSKSFACAWICMVLVCSGFPHRDLAGRETFMYYPFCSFPVLLAAALVIVLYDPLDKWASRHKSDSPNKALHPVNNQSGSKDVADPSIVGVRTGPPESMPRNLGNIIRSEATLK